MFGLPLESHQGDRHIGLLGTKGERGALPRAACTLAGRTSIVLAWRPCTDRRQGPFLSSALSVIVTLTGLFLLQLAQMGGQP